MEPLERRTVADKSRTYTLTRIAMLTTLVSVGRLSFSFLPNVQPMTVLLVCITLYYGWKDSLAVSLLSVLITNIYLGMGPWTFAQLASYAVIILLTSLLEDSYETIPLPVMQFYMGFLGLLYGLIISLVQAPFFGWNIFLPYYLSGLPYDLLHAVANMVFFALLYPISMRVFKQTDHTSTMTHSIDDR